MRNLCSRLLFHKNFLNNRLLTSAFVLVNGIVFNRSNGLIKEVVGRNGEISDLNKLPGELGGSVRKEC